MRKPYVIGIAGGSASGKTTTANKLAEMLKDLDLLVIHMDSYFRKDLPMSPGPITGKVYKDFNMPASLELDRLRGDLQAALDKNEHSVILIEGLMTLWDKELSDMLDLRLFIECRTDERILRRLKRNLAAGMAYDDITSYYLDLVRYRHDEYVEPSKWRADLILNGAHMSQTALDMLAFWIRGQLRKD